MNQFLAALCIGLIAGILDIIPMLIQRLDKRDILSAFIHDLVLGFIIPFVSWEIAPWLKGLIISLTTALPILILVYPKDKKAIFSIIIFSLFLGAGMGFVGAMLIE